MDALQALARGAASMTAAAIATVDIVVPVYNAAADLRRCVESVLARTSGDYRLLLIDDASSDPAIRNYFNELQARQLPQLVLLANERNIGFAPTANRGMHAARNGADVVLLNSDAIVTSEWLDALARCVHSDPAIGTATPFSNNAEICSLPHFCENNVWPAGRDPEPMAQALRLAAVPTYPDVPTGVGFCMYVRRETLDAIGAFDPVFGLGYGEENDFCMRAAVAGYRSVLCEDAFVLHAGGRSFGDQRHDLTQRNGALLLDRHPHYGAQVRDFIAADPLRPLRELALSHYRVLTADASGILHVIHGHGGGAEYHVRSLIAASGSAFRHYVLMIVNDECLLEEHGDGALRSYEFARLAGEPWSDFLGGICARFHIDLVHLHYISGGRDGLAEALAVLGIAYGYTVHDLIFACPTTTLLNADHRYCGAVTDPVVCNTCLSTQPAFAGIDIVPWRASRAALLAGAAFVIAPSQWAAATLHRYFPSCAVEVIPHAASGGATRPDAVATPLTMPDDDVPVVGVVGAIGLDKGARRLERMVELTRERGLPLRWVLIGYLDCRREPWQSDDAVFTMHGPYNSRALSSLLDHYRVQLVAYPSVCPETYSFTLSEAWTAGRPAIVPPVGALAERVAATGAGWALSEDDWRSEERMLERIAAILAPGARTALTTATTRARAVVLPAPAMMAERTLDIYRRSMRPATAATRAPIAVVRCPIAATRCLSALHYEPWRPAAPSAAEVPVATATATAAPVERNAFGRVATFALHIRHTLPGRVLHRFAPKALLAALKSHL
jgi:GT2 family glycosyltransferase/glycosyltransferase involved in cell wall biosynthesis